MIRIVIDLNDCTWLYVIAASNNNNNNYITKYKEK